METMLGWLLACHLKTQKEQSLLFAESMDCVSSSVPPFPAKVPFQNVQTKLTIHIFLLVLSPTQVLIAPLMWGGGKEFAYEKPLLGKHPKRAFQHFNLQSYILDRRDIPHSLFFLLSKQGYFHLLPRPSQPFPPLFVTPFQPKSKAPSFLLLPRLPCSSLCFYLWNFSHCWSCPALGLPRSAGEAFGPGCGLPKPDWTSFSFTPSE